MSSSLLTPPSVEDAVRALRDDPDATVIAGGTDVVPSLRTSTHFPRLVNLRGITGLREITVEQGRWRLGSTATIADLRGTPGLAEDSPALDAACRSLGSRQVRNRATVGGNICRAGATRTLVPVFLALDATVEVAGPGGVGSRPLRGLLSAEGLTLEHDEIATAVAFDRTEGPQVYYRVGPRNAVCFATATVALVVDEPARSVRLALGGVGPTAVRAEDAEAVANSGIDWQARQVAADVCVAFGDAAAAAADPSTDQFASAEYRRHAVRVMARRALKTIFAEEPK